MTYQLCYLQDQLFVCTVNITVSSFYDDCNITLALGYSTIQILVGRYL